MKNRLNFRVRFPFFEMSIILIAVVLFVSGCGGGDEPEQAVEKPAKPTQTDGNQQQPPDNPNDTTGSSSVVTVDPEQGKMLDGIPYDVWFKDPLGVASENRQVASIPDSRTPTNPQKPSSGSPNSTTSSPEPEDPPAAGIDWKEIIPAEILSDEVKKIRNRFTSNLRTVGEYNTSYLEFEPFCATLSVMAQIASLHSGDISWKKNALIVRDLSVKMVENKLTRGAKSYKTIKLPFEQLVDTFSGSPPADVGEPDTEATFSDVASMGVVMKRIDALSKNIKTNAGNADALKSNSDSIRHEAYVLAALMKALNTEGYGYVDDETFLEFSNILSENAGKMAKAAETGEFEAFESAQSKVFQNCTVCHNKYRE